MKKNVSGQTIGAQLIALSDGSNVVSGTTNVFVTGDGGTQSAGSATVTHEGNGYWSYTPTQSETNFDHVAFTFVNSLAVSATIQTYTTFPQTADINIDSRLNNLDASVSSRSTFNPTSDTVANVTNCANNSDMRGTDSVPTNPLLTNDSRLNNLDATISSRSTFDSSTDQVVASNMRGTDGANTVTPPTEAEIYTYFTSSNRQDTFKADITSILTSLTNIYTDTQRVDGLIEDVSGNRFTTKALEQAPSGGGGDVNVTQVGGVAVTSPDDLKADVSAIPTNPLLTNDSRLDNLDASISSIASQISGLNDPSTTEIRDALLAVSDSFKANVSSLATSAEIAALNDPSTSDIVTALQAVADDFKADVSALATSAEITALNDPTVNDIVTGLQAVADDFKADVTNLDATISSRSSQVSQDLILKYHDNTTRFLGQDGTTEVIQELSYFMQVLDNDGSTPLKTIAFRDVSNNPVTLSLATKYVSI